MNTDLGAVVLPHEGHEGREARIRGGAVEDDLGKRSFVLFVSFVVRKAVLVLVRGPRADVRVRAHLRSYAACLLLAGSLLCGGISAGAAECSGEPAVAAEDAGIHAPFDGLLRAFVHDGVVDYGCFQVHERQLDDYLRALADVDLGELSRGEQLALWINAYNAFTIKLILSRYPKIASIKEIPRRWDQEDWTVGGRKYSLDKIENEILRKQFHEPRIHFAIVCASKSCPDLAPEAYLDTRLDEQLDRAARRFVADPGKGSKVARGTSPLGRSVDKLYLSSIFKWFRADFEREGSLVDFVMPYLTGDERFLVEEANGDPPIAFLDYDWTLNGK